MIETLYYKTVRRNNYAVCYWRLNDSQESIKALDWANKYNLNGIYNKSLETRSSLVSESGAASKLFGSAGNYVEIPDAIPLRLISNFSIEVWVLPLAQGQTTTIIGKINNAFSISNPYYLGLENGSLTFKLGNGVSQFSVKSQAILVGSASHIIVGLNRGSLYIIINGKLIESKSIGAQEIKDGAQPVFIGSKGNSTSSFVGLISDVALYSGPVYTSTAEEHFNIGRKILPNELYYKTFDPPNFS